MTVTDRLIPKLIPLAATALLCATLASSPAWAQGFSRGAGDFASSQVGRMPTGPQPRPAPALPGAKPAAPVAAPAEKGAADMSPNDALFDAINRGDLASARDAISRGAQLDATNVLGLTPLALSVDLGRNDISFLLLAMRGDVTEPPPAAQAAAATPKMLVSDKHARAHQQRRLADKEAAPEPTYSGNGGPDPQRGFLGFGR